MKNRVKMYKRIKGVLLSICLIMGRFTVLPGEINAEPEGDPIYDATGLTSIRESGKYYLAYDIEGDWTIPDNKQVTLDLNGKTLRGHIKIPETASGQPQTVLILNDSADGGNINGNQATDVDAVCIYSGSKFIMNNGKICNGKCSGVYNKYGEFIMNGGTISGNELSSSGLRGAGVHNEGTFEMTGGTITGNTAIEGGGVYNYPGSSFTMRSGAISGNTAQYGGGVYINNGGTFKMTGGTITGNTVSNNAGGGVCNFGTFEMTGGTISGNTASQFDGGGVWNSGTFEMTGGTISGNTASQNGGGIYNYNSGIVRIEGGTITRNTATNGGGGILNCGTLSIDKATISVNKASEGGGIYWWSDPTTIKGGTIKGNTTNASTPDPDDLYIGNKSNRSDCYLEGSPDIGVIRFTNEQNHGFISLSGPLTNKEPIAIDAPYLQGNPYIFAKKSVNGLSPRDYIFQLKSKNDSYGIGYNGDAHSLKLAPAAPAPKSVTVSPNDIKAFTGYSEILPFTANAEMTSPGILTGYQWYTNTVNSNEGGTPIEGAIEKEYTCPSGLAVGTYYYYCMVRSISIGQDGSNDVVRQDPTNVVYLEVKPVPVDGVVLDKDSFTMELGSSFSLTPTISPSNATNKKVKWETGNPNVATVDNGVVTGKSIGEAVITVRTEDGGKIATCRVKVVGVPVRSLTLDKTSLKLECGQTAGLSPTVNPSNASDKTLTWASSNKKVATVSKEGLVTAVGGGNATITVTSSNGKTAGCKVKVKEYKDIKRVYVHPSRLILKAGKSRTLKAVILPTRARNKRVTWTSKNPKIATVSEKGKVKALKKGTTYITVKTADGKKTKRIKVMVK